MMEWLKSFGLRIKSLMRRRQRETDLDDELAFHKAMRNSNRTAEDTRRFGNGLKWRVIFRNSRSSALAFGFPDLLMRLAWYLGGYLCPRPGLRPDSQRPTHDPHSFTHAE